MKIRDIIAPLEEFAPLALQESYDNAGLVVGSYEWEVAGALLCVDATQDVVDEAIEKGAGLVIAHHPVIFHPLRAIGQGGTNVENVVVRAVKNDIAIYAAHTNLDRAQNGMSHALAQKLGLRNIEVLDTMGATDGTGFGAVGELPEPVDAIEFLRHVRTALNIGAIRHSPPTTKTVRRVALITGSGGDGLQHAIDAGADVFLSADLRHDRFLAAEGRILIADIGHHESEFCAIDLMHDVISKKIPNFALHKSTRGRNPVRYLF